MKTILSIPASVHPSHWIAITLSWTVTLAMSTGCSLERVPPPVAPTPSPFGQGDPLTRGPATTVRLGEVVTGTVVVGDQACYTNWDADALCRWFTVVAPAKGVLTATLRASRADGWLDIFSLPRSREPVPRDPDLAWRLSLFVAASQEVLFAVMAYEFPETFTLQIEFK